MTHPHPTPAPALPGDAHVTPDTPPIGGVLKQRPEDFLVEEIPLFEPTGSGEHIILFVEKTDLSTTRVRDILARHANVQPADIGYAGMKDKRAVTRQQFSIHAPNKNPEDLPELRHPTVKVLWADLHDRKLRPGMLRGNRFSIKARAVRATDVLAADRAMRTLARTGAPNLFGEQRFGRLLNNHAVGLRVLLRENRAALDILLGPNPGAPTNEHEPRDAYARRDYAHALRTLPHGLDTERRALETLSRGGSPRDAVMAIGRTQRRFFLNALQSAVFNAVAARRVHDQTLDTLEPGDLAYKHDSGAVFPVDQHTAELPDTAERLRRILISPSGPIWGHKMTRPAGHVLQREQTALTDLGIEPDDFLDRTKRLGRWMSGERRPLRVPLIDPEVEGGADEHGEYLRCAFELPPGCFATAVMEQILKTSAAPQPAASTP